MYKYRVSNCIFSLLIILSLRQMSEMERVNGNLKREAKSHSEKLKEVQTSRDEEKKLADALEIELQNLHQVHKDVLAENESLKAEVQKGVEEIVTALSEGYTHCLERMSKAGFSTEGHSFEDFIRDYAASQPVDNRDSVDPCEH